MNTRQALTIARAGLILDQPFFGQLALRLPLVPDDSVKTMQTNGDNIRYNPQFVDGLSPAELKGVLAHEVMHCACSHMHRRDQREPKRWNQAADYAINPILIESGMTLPADALNQPCYKDMSAEQIYAAMPEGNDGGGEKPDPHGNPDDQSGNDPGGCGGVDDAPNDAAHDPQQQEQEWKIATAQAAQAAKMMGKLPAGLARLVQEIIEPKVDWRAELRDFIERTARNDYNWNRPSRRFSHLGVCLPTLLSDQLPPIVVAIDTSGSINGPLLDAFMGEVESILATFHIGATIVYCDYAIAHVQEIEPGEPIVPEPRGGGGTAFEPVFDWVNENKPDAAAILYFTDLYGSFPADSEIPTLWASYGAAGHAAPFGRTIEVQP